MTTAATVYVNGSVYSPADPFATAVLVEGSTVAWLGSDGAAHAMAGESARVVDLDGAVVTPSFVAHQWVTGSETLVRPDQGYGAVELVARDAAALADAVERAERSGLVPLPVLVAPVRTPEDAERSGAPRARLGFAVQDVADSEDLVEALTAHLAACTRAGYQAVIVCGGTDRDSADAAPDTVDAVLDAVRAAQVNVGERAFRARGHRLTGVGALTEAQCEDLAHYALTVSSRPAAAPLTALTRAGVPVTLMTEEPNPWAAVKATLEAEVPAHRTSARAAFLALTRGVWRAQRDAPPLAGQLVPGAQADLSVWDAQSLMVQQAQGTAASWSTDPRARTPVLPALDDPRLPACERTVTAGRPVIG